MNKKTIAFIIAAAIGGGLAGSAVTVFPARADIFSDIFNGIQSFLRIRDLPKLPAVELPKFGSVKATGAATTAPSYVSRVDYEDAVISSVERSSPAVVSIIISKDVPIIERCRGTNPFSDLPPEFQQFFGQDFEFSVPCERGTKKQEVGGGSGFIVTSDGIIVTNKHVVNDTRASYTVFTNDGRKFDAKILARDPARDIAIVKINASKLPIVKLGDSGSIKLGQTVIAIGNALGEFRNTVSVGVVSGLSRNITAQGDGLTERIEGLIQSDAAINPGNSGGPLLDLKGEVVGMNTAMVSGAQNIGFAIPINSVRQAIESVKREGRIVAPFIGVRYVLITPDIAKQKNLSVESGALINAAEGSSAVVDNSPAAKAGIKDGDVILEVNGEKVGIDNSLAVIIQKYNVGDTVVFKILRNGGNLNVRVKLEERP